MRVVLLCLLLVSCGTIPQKQDKLQLLNYSYIEKSGCKAYFSQRNKEVWIVIRCNPISFKKDKVLPGSIIYTDKCEDTIDYREFNNLYDWAY